MNPNDLWPRMEKCPPAATAAEQAAARRVLLRGVGIEDAGEAGSIAVRLAARAAAVRVTLERGDLDGAALDEAVTQSRELRRQLETLEAAL